MSNINTKEYWENRFAKNWKKNGERQTTEYAKANVAHLSIPKGFEGTILDFGCAKGDAIPVYSDHFPKAKLIGIDISEIAIEGCRKKYGSLAEFRSGNISSVPAVDVIIASHVMEHLTDDKSVALELLKKCQDLFVFVPYKENPLFEEHVNYYTDNYYDDLGVVHKIDFRVEYDTRLPLKAFLKGLLKLQFRLSNKFSKEIIMFHFRGNL